MEYQDDKICLGSGVELLGLEELVFSAILGYPSRDVHAEILRDRSRYLFNPLNAPPSFPQTSRSPTGLTRVGHLFSKRLKNAFDYNFEQHLQPSILDLRSMYESGDTVRSFIVTNGVGWAFRLFDFHNVSLVELSWLELGFIKALRNKESIEEFFKCIPKRMALGLLQNNGSIIEFLVDELEATVTRFNRSQDSPGPAMPVQEINKILALAAGAIMLGEAFQQKEKLWSKEVFEHHAVKAFEAIRQGDNRQAFGEVLKLSLPAISILTKGENNASKLLRIVDISSRLRQLRLPEVRESERLKTLIEFLEETLEQAYLFLKEGYDKRKSQSMQKKQSEKRTDDSAISVFQTQIDAGRSLEFHEIEEFMLKATKSYPNRVIGRIMQSPNQANHYSITDVRVVPCDVAIKISLGSATSRGSADRHDTDCSPVLVGTSVSEACCCEHEMLTLLHPKTYALNEMLRSGYSLNAIAITNGERCLLRLHDGSDNTIITARYGFQTTGE
jgi:hypothetical protein